MSLKVTPQGEIKKEKQMPKYYQPKIEWVQISPEMKKKYLAKLLPRAECIAIGKGIRYSSESIAYVFRKKPDRVNKVIWDAITKYLDTKLAQPKPAAIKKENHAQRKPYMSEAIKKKLGR